MSTEAVSPFTSEALRALLFDHTSDAVVISNTDGLILDWNRAASDVFGYTRSEILGRSVEMLLHPDARKEYLLKFRDEAALNEYWACELEILRKDGASVPSKLLASFIYDPDGKKIGLLQSFRDISEQKQTEQTLKQSEERLLAIVDNSPMLIYVRDINWRYILVNRFWEETLGLDRSYIVGRTIFDVFPENVADRLLENDRKVLAEKRALQFEESYTRNGTTRVFLSVKFPLLDEDGEVYAICGISTDITDSKKRQEELVRYTHELELDCKLQEEDARKLGALVEELRRANERAEAAVKAKSEFLAQYEPRDTYAYECCHRSCWTFGGD